MGMRQPPPPQGPPSGPPSQPPGQSAPPAAGGITKLVASIFSQLTQLMDALSQAAQSQPDVISPDDIQQLSQIIKAYQQFVTQTLGGAPGGGGGPSKTAPGPQPVSPMQGGQPSSNVKPVGY